jgi:structural maintenance of chromosome 1
VLFLTFSKRLIGLLQRPSLITLEAQITHSTRKLNNATKARAELVKSTDAQQVKLDGLKKELDKVKAAADAAQGE